MRLMKTGLMLMLIVCMAVSVSSVQAAYTPLGNSGWAMIVNSKMQPVDSPYIYGIANDAVVLELHKTFNKPKDENGFFTPIVIEFMKISADATSKIIIEDEYIQNSTGFEWDDFHMQLMVNMVNPQAGFSQNLIDGDQLENVSYDNMVGYDGMPISLNFKNGQGQGVLSSPPGEDVFMPGFVFGNIQINVNPNMAVGTRFALKEIPTSAPEPATLMILGLGGLAILKKKRNSSK